MEKIISECPFGKCNQCKYVNDENCYGLRNRVKK
jgi:hypothetical protein